MSGRWYKRCGADFIHGTMMLSLEEKGAYSLCLDLIYDRGGPIPDDARWLSGVCGVSIRKWNAIRERLLELGKLAIENGLISNSRAAFELVSAELSSRKLAEAGSKGGRKRAENQFDYSVISGLAQATLKLYREDKRREEGTPQPPEGGRRGKTVLPEGWELPAVADLPPKARACAEQWTRESYEARGEEFVSFWRSRGRTMKDWRLTWAGRVVALHSQVMRDQKHGNAPPGDRAKLSPEEVKANQASLADLYDRMGRTDDAAEIRRKWGTGPSETALSRAVAGIMRTAAGVTQ